MVISDDIKATFNSMHEGILIIDTSRTIVFGNQAYLDFVTREFGIPEQSDFLGRINFPSYFLFLNESFSSPF